MAIDINTLRTAYGTTYRKEYYRNTLFKPLVDTSHESDMRTAQRKYIPINTTDYSLPAPTAVAAGNDITNFTWRTTGRGGYDTDHILLTWEYDQKWDRDISPKIVDESPVNVMAENASQQAMSVARAQDKVIWDKFRAADVSAVKPHPNATPIDSSSNVFNVGSNSIRLAPDGIFRQGGAGANPASDSQDAIYNLIREVRLYLESNNLWMDNTWRAAMSPVVRSQIQHYQDQHRPALEVLRQESITGNYVDRLHGIDLYTTNLAGIVSNRSSADLEETKQSGGTDAYPIIFFRKDALTYGERFNHIKVDAPGDNPFGYYYRVNGLLEYYSHIVNSNGIVKAWVRA